MTYQDPATVAPSSPPASDSSAPSAPSFGVGNLVSHSWEDGAGATHTRYGAVVGIVAPTFDEKGAPLELGGPLVAWFDTAVSGPLAADALELVS